MRPRAGSDRTCHRCGAQIGFVAPVGSDVEARVGVLREGRSVAQVTTDLFCEGAPVLRALWLFGAARPTNGGVPAMRADEAIPVEEAAPVTATDDAPQFIHNFEMRRAEPRGARDRVPSAAGCACAIARASIPSRNWWASAMPCRPARSGPWNGAARSVRSTGR
jgi:hypothetical protein